MRLRLPIVLASAMMMGYCALPVHIAPVMAQGLPGSSELLQRVATAAGGDAVARQITSRVSKGFIVTPAGRAPLTLSQKAPNRFLVIIDSPAGGLSRNAFDGHEAWSANSRGVESRSGPEAGMFVRENTIHREIRLTQLFQSVGVEGTADIGGRQALVVRAVASDGLIERFSFDAESFLLVRHEVEMRGTSLRSDFEDYRVVNGAPVAHRIKRSRPDFSWSTELVSVEQNVSIEDALFSRPASQ